MINKILIKLLQMNMRRDNLDKYNLVVTTNDFQYKTKESVDIEKDDLLFECCTCSSVEVRKNDDYRQKCSKCGNRGVITRTLTSHYRRRD